MKEETLNAITHGMGTVLAIIGLAVIVVAAYHSNSIWHLISFFIYGGSLVLLYLASTLYHSFSNEKLKGIFKIIDHSAIYLLIAGTYTPFALVTLDGQLGWNVFAIVWGIAAVGIVFQIFFVKRFKVFSTLCYILMGWLAVFVIQPLAAALPIAGLYWLIGGGLFYTVGSVFYLYRRIPYNHAVWHLFVLAGSVSHFIAVLFYVLPVSVLD
jgi:hemolysin III